MPAPAVSRGGLILADAVQDTARAVTRAGALHDRREDRFAYAKAKSTLLQADIDARRELENDPDYGTYETRYREKMAKAREAATGLIRSQRDRALFDEDAKLDVERGSFDISRQAWAREVDVERGNLDALLEKNRAAALNAKDEATRAALVEAAGELIEGARQKTYLNEQEATNLQQKWTADYGKGFVLMQPVDEQIRLLSKPKGTVADFIDPADRAVMLERATKEKEQEERARAQEERSRIQQSRSDAEWAQRQNADAAWKMVAEGKTVAEIQRTAPGVWRGMDGRDQVALLNDEKTRVNGNQTATDWNLYFELIAKAKTDEGRAELNKTLPNYYDRLAPAQRLDMISRIAAKPGSADDLDALTLDQQVSDAMPGAKPKERGPFRTAVGTAVEAESRRIGRKLTQPERQQIIDQMVLEGGNPGDWRNKEFYKVAGTPEADTFVPEGYEQITPEELKLIAEALTQTGRKVTPVTVYATWKAAGGGK
jgi:hypothetical protein